MHKTKDKTPKCRKFGEKFWFSKGPILSKGPMVDYFIKMVVALTTYYMYTSHLLISNGILWHDGGEFYY